MVNRLPLPMRLLLSLLACLLASCAIRQPAAALAVPREPSTIVIVHGLFATPGHVRPVHNALTAEGLRCLSPALTPNDGSLSIEGLAQQLDRYISQELPPQAPIQLVGHSMGGLVALEYLNHHGGSSRTRALYTIASPHQGTLLANLHGGAGGREMIAGSSFLTRLNATTPNCPVTTYRSTRDLVIIPNSSSALPYADNQVITSPGHNEVLSAPALHQDLARRIQQVDQR